MFCIYTHFLLIAFGAYKICLSVDPCDFFLWQLLELAFEAKNKLIDLGVFNEVDMLVDTSSGKV